MNFQDTGKYIQAERFEILRYKIKQSKTSHHDINNNDAALTWINENADAFRQKWERKHNA